MKINEPKDLYEIFRTTEHFGRNVLHTHTAHRKRDDSVCLCNAYPCVFCATISIGARVSIGRNEHVYTLYVHDGMFFGFSLHFCLKYSHVFVCVAELFGSHSGRVEPKFCSFFFVFALIRSVLFCFVFRMSAFGKTKACEIKLIRSSTLFIRCRYPYYLLVDDGSAPPATSNGE